MTPARVSTIVWGVLLLLLAGAAFAITALDVEIFSGASIAYVVVGLGALLVVAAIVGAIARAVKPAAPAPVVEAVAPEPVVEPVETPAPKPRAKKNQPVD